MTQIRRVVTGGVDAHADDHAALNQLSVLLVRDVFQIRPAVTTRRWGSTTGITLRSGAEVAIRSRIWRSSGFSG